MTIQEIIVSILLTVVGSSAVWQTITWFVDRYDKKKTSKEDILKEVEKVHEEVEQVSGKVDDLADTVDKNQAVLARTHILRFSDELKNGVEHSAEYFRQQLDDCDTYEKFCNAHPEFKNSYTEIANIYIKETYERLLKEGKL